MKELFDMIVMGAKALILASIAVIFVRCAVGDLDPDVHVEGLSDGDEIQVEVIEGKDRETIIIRKNGTQIVRVPALPLEE